MNKIALFLEKLLSIVLFPATACHEYSHYLAYTYLFNREAEIEFNSLKLDKHEPDKVKLNDDQARKLRLKFSSDGSVEINNKPFTQTLVSTVLAPFFLFIPFGITVISAFYVHNSNGSIFNYYISIFLFLYAYGFLLQTGPSPSDLKAFLSDHHTENKRVNQLFYYSIRTFEIGILVVYGYLTIDYITGVPF